jgi:hypothetical protein
LGGKKVQVNDFNGAFFVVFISGDSFSTRVFYICDYGSMINTIWNLQYLRAYLISSPDNLGKMPPTSLIQN